MPITIPKEHYLGIKLSDKSDDTDVPLGFLTPDGTDKAAEKRKKTVDEWCQGYQYYGRAKKSVEGKDYEIRKNMSNDPQTGFRITKSISRSGGWSGNNKVVRIEDPRGFELEISVDNLVKIMTMTTVTNGEINEACVWGRDGARNVLLPVNSEPYNEAVKNTIVKNKGYLKSTEYNIGDKVEFKRPFETKAGTGIYLGLYNIYCVQDIVTSDNLGQISHLGGRTQQFIKTYKRHIFEVLDKKGNFMYQGFARPNIYKVISSGERKTQPDFAADMYEEMSSSDAIMRLEQFAASPARIPLETVAKSAHLKPFDIKGITLTKEQYYLFTADYEMLSFEQHRNVFNYADAAKRKRITKGVTISRDNNKWNAWRHSFLDEVIPQEHQWHLLAFKINDKVFTLNYKNYHF